MLTPHITHPLTTAEWRENFNKTEWHPKDFWDEMQEGEDYINEFVAKHSGEHAGFDDTWEPMNETFAGCVCVCVCVCVCPYIDA